MRLFDCAKRVQVCHACLWLYRPLLVQGCWTPYVRRLPARTNGSPDRPRAFATGLAPNAHRSQIPNSSRFTPSFVSESTGRSPEFPRLPVLSTLTYMSFRHIIFHNISLPRIAYPGDGSDNLGQRGLVPAEESEQIGDDRSVRLRIRMQRSCGPKAMIHRWTWTAFFAPPEQASSCS
jgi:hypothetical protein